jgi:hypothetical protein
MINWKGCGRKRSWSDLSHYPEICLEGLRETTRNLSQHSRFPGRDLNPERPEYEGGTLTTTFGKRYLVEEIGWDGRSWFTWLGYGPVEGFCEMGNELLDSIKAKNFLTVWEELSCFVRGTMLHRVSYMPDYLTDIDNISFSLIWSWMYSIPSHQRNEWN